MAKRDKGSMVDPVQGAGKGQSVRIPGGRVLRFFIEWVKTSKTFA